MHLVYAVPVMHDANRIDSGKAAQRLFELTEVHGYVA